jgi:hypothetical protein
MPPSSYRIPIDGKWELVDLYQFPHTYSQIYSVLYVLEEQLSKPRTDRRDYIFSKYPWRGGYSTVNWFNGLYHTIPRDERPKVISLSYASPGWIDLGISSAIAATIRKMLIAFSEAGRHLNETYSQIQDGVHKRKLNDIKIRKQELLLEGERLKFVRKSCEEMARLMGFKHLEEMHALTGNPLVTLKMLSALYRRLRTLEEFEEDGKTRIKDPPQSTPRQ